MTTTSRRVLAAACWAAELVLLWNCSQIKNVYSQSFMGQRIQHHEGWEDEVLITGLLGLLALFPMGFQTCPLHLVAEGSGKCTQTETLQSMARGGHSHNSRGHLTMEREVTQHAGHGLKLCQQWEGGAPRVQDGADSPGALSTLAQQQPAAGLQSRNYHTPLFPR